ncbi:hypothetical protein Malapachy_2103 [Malassezia pachydermatis]|uniref:Uncharacterized protein n=1 Tax=Malassezia pachydermatis TaxID=77020 RepID=A0A0M9VQC6_9BASI|nr:hypothetical protein Malapachy_2103 [Malassezia pachydermatis]KOS15352.1 hypothetical protein Malapachy_2103 [Malassezia pachydermatis]
MVREAQGGGSCFSSLGGGNKDKSLNRTETNRGNELHRTTSSFQGSVADSMRYSDNRRVADPDRLTASQVHKSKTLEDRIRQAERENRARA